MHISSAVAHKLRRDRELLDLLKSADPHAPINRGILLTLNHPEIPKDSVSEEQRTAFIDRIREVADRAEQGFSGIEDLTVYNLMKGIAHASVGGTAEAIVKALELDCVREGIIGDRPVFRGAAIS